MLAAGNLGEQVRSPIHLSGLRQELSQAEPTTRLDDGRRHDALDELGRSPSVAGSAVRNDRRAVVGEARIDLQRLEEVEEKLGVLRPTFRRPSPDMCIAILTQQHAQLALRPTPL